MSPSPAQIGLAQGLSKVRAEALGDEMGIDELWKDSAARAVALRLGISQLQAEVLVTEPDNKGKLEEARKYKAPTIKKS